MALFEKQDIKNEKKEKNLQTEKHVEKLSLDDDLMGSVSGGDGVPAGFSRNPSNELNPVLGTCKF